jgi:hypothetical protein
MPRKKGPPFKPITFRLRHPAEEELEEMAVRFHTNKTELLHRLIRRAYKELKAEKARDDA